MLSTLLIAACVSTTNIHYPKTERSMQVDKIHGVKVFDPYRQLEDKNSKKVQEWVQEQNATTKAFMETIPFRDAIEERIRALYQFSLETAPITRGDHTFIWQASPDLNQPRLFVENEKGERRLLLDVNTLSSDQTISVSAFYPSWDGKHVAFLISQGGSDWQTIYVVDTATGKMTEEPIEWVKFSRVAWDEKGFFYCRYNAVSEEKAHTALTNSQQVYYHTLGTSIEKDALIYANNDKPKMMYSIETTQDMEYLILTMSENWTKNAVYIKPLKKEQGLIPIIPAFEGRFTPIDIIGRHFYLHTNRFAPMGRIIRIDLQRGAPIWEEIVPETHERLLNAEIVNNQLVLHYLNDATSRLELTDLDGKHLDEIRIPGMGSVSQFEGSRKGKELHFIYTSYTTPKTVLRYDFGTKRTYEVYKPDFPLNLEEYETKRVFYTSHDGTQVPLFIVRKKDLPRRPAPTLLYAYGGFDIAMQPYFRASDFALLEKGGTLAVACIRGGGEYGEKWHKEGSLLNKKNGFNDFICAGEYLIDQKYTSSDLLAISGRSNGGLLIGAVTVKRPDLCKVALPGVGVLDMLRFHLFTIGWSWTREYGSVDNPEDFHNLYSYSPYHNLKKGVLYPATLVTTGEGDDRVVPAHSYKYISALQHLGAPSNPYLIRIERNAGHGQGMSKSQRIGLLADEYAFMLCNMNFPYTEESDLKDHRDSCGDN